VLTACTSPAAPAGQRSAYRKARVRGAMDFPLAGVAVALRLADGRLTHCDIGVSGVASRPLALSGLDELIGAPVDAALLAAVGKAVQKQVSPMRSTTAESNYRRQVAATLAQRLVQELAHRVD
jgi:4-hydroxybenzoyl-CoA reductase subunit beta